MLFVLATADRRMRIEVGYGLEPVISDSSASDFLHRIKYLLKAQDYGTAVGEIIGSISEATAHLKPGDVAEGLSRPGDPEHPFSIIYFCLILLALVLTIFMVRWLKSWGQQTALALSAVALIWFLGGPTGGGWAVILLVNLVLARILLQGLFPAILGSSVSTEPEFNTFQLAPHFYRWSLLSSWVICPIWLYQDSALDETYPYVGYALDGVVFMWVWTFGGAGVLGTLAHISRISSGGGGFGGGGGGGTFTSSGRTDTFSSSNWSSSDWSSSSFGSSSSSSVGSSSSGSDWSGGGGDFGGGGASDSW